MFGYKMSDYDKKVYAEQLADFLPDKMIDAHAHIWKKEFDPATTEEQKACVSWTRMVAEDCSIEDLMQTYTDMFPGKKMVPVLMGWPMTTLPLTNEYTREAAKKINVPAFYCTDYSMTAEHLE